MAEQQFDNELRGAAWVKERKSDRAPHFEGTCQIRGEEFQVALWDTGESGRKPALKLRFKPMDEVRAEREAYKAQQAGGQSSPRRAEQAPAQQQNYGNDLIDSDLPF